MFQSYYDVDKDIIITSKSDEATVNGYCQEISVAEIKAALAKEKKDNFFTRIIKRFKRLGGKK